MKTWHKVSRRQFLLNTAALGGLGLTGIGGLRLLAGTPHSSHADLLALRRAMIDTPVRVGRHRARVFTAVFLKNEEQPWMVRKARALREYFETVPLYLREHDGIAGSISETPGAMPVMVELGIGENDIYTGERPDRVGYLKGKVQEDIRDYWKNRNRGGFTARRSSSQTSLRQARTKCRACLDYKFISNQGHLSPSYRELLQLGLGGLLRQVKARRQRELELRPAEPSSRRLNYSLEGVSAWAQRYGDFLSSEAGRETNASRAAELREMARIAGKVAAAAAGDVPRGAAIDLVRRTRRSTSRATATPARRTGSTSCCCRSTRPT